MNIQFYQTILPMLFQGVKVTFFIAVLGILCGLIIAGFCGFILQSKLKFLKIIAEIYIWIIRSTPLMVQALYVYFVIPKLTGIDFKATTVGIFVIALNSGAFMSEIIKGSLQSIDIGQKEAAASLGLTKLQIMIHVIIPPAIKIALPGLFNQFIISVKDTALLSVITVNEVTHQAQTYASLSFQTIPTYTVLAVFYLIIISVLIVFQKFVEKKLG
ncbi:amino acid ABC transporter permease [uncultured Clostridium sp.]|uniref:amino acid ABC transporter permease n=1 Tax=uncultured Clostridium sp. TaxID=59620 RepID=UPI0025F5EB70|nr:amino acid ABC transporter permease [uncultured Clostridium sp.]